ncbi:MAG: cell division protein FtsA [Tannerella sp.]|jgi:cell division protein FtsA|nr:cell division protein FtsA [Tannerella sp.]
MEQLITALYVGTSKIIASVARKNSSGKLSILKTDEIDSENCIRRGCVYNSTETSRKISDLLTRLDSHIFYNYKTHLEEIYVGIGGQSLHLEYYKIIKEVPNGTVNLSLLGEIETEIKEYQPELAKVFEILPPEYYLDGQLQPNNSRGTEASVIEARYPLIVGSPKLKGLIERALPDKYKIAGFFISPLATAYSILKKNEKELGCALVEMGKGLTYVSIYKAGNLKYLFTLPLGGIAITKDIRALNMSEEGAEKLKIKYGSAILDYGDGTAIKIDDEFSTAKEIELKNLNMIVEARSDEILVNVARKIEESGFADALGAGIILTGGAALLKNLPEALHNLTKKDVRLAYATSFSTDNNEITHPASYSCVVGLLTMAGKSTINKNPPTIVKPPVKPIEDPNVTSPSKSTFIDRIFSNGHSAKEEKEKTPEVVVPQPVVTKKVIEKDPVQPVINPVIGKRGRKLTTLINRWTDDLFKEEDYKQENKKGNENENKNENENGNENENKND